MQQLSGATPPDPSADQLARAFLETLARQGGAKIKRMVRRASPEIDAVEALFADLPDPPADDAPSLRPDLAAAAILVARALATEEGLVRQLRHGGPVVVIDTNSSDLVSLTQTVIEACAFSTASPAALIVARDGSERSHRPDSGNSDVLFAVNRRRPIVGIASEPKRLLPLSLMRAAEYRLALPAIDEHALRLVIEAVSGETIDDVPIEPELIRLLDITDLPLSIRQGLSAEECLKRLQAIIRTKGDFVAEGPTLEELHGYGDAKRWGLELAADLADYKTGKLSWDLVDHKGLLLSGPPGTGKTTFARALAKSARVPLTATSVAEWNSAPHLGGTLQAIRNSFAQAKRTAPSILFIDEVDGISNRITISGDYVEYWTQLVNLFLELLAGVNEREGVVVIAATNFPDKLDPAIRRAGRLDQEIVLQMPGAETLVQIFRYHLGAGVLENVDLMPLANAGRGKTGADVEAWCRRAKAAARRARRDVSLDDVLAEIRGGKAALPESIKSRVAVHEAGHVVVGRGLNLGKILSVEVDDKGGITTLDSGFDGSFILGQIKDSMVLCLAGRVAEELILGSVSAGSPNSSESDLAKASEFALAIEAKFGFGSYGNLYFEDGLADLIRVPGMMAAARKHLDEAAERARTILGAQLMIVKRVAEALEQRGYLSGADVEVLLSGSAAEPQTQRDNVNHKW